MNPKGKKLRSNKWSGRYLAITYLTIDKMINNSKAVTFIHVVFRIGISIVDFFLM